MAQWLLELVERVTKPNQHDPALYDLVVRMFGEMGRETDALAGQQWLRLLRRAWLILGHQGFAPSLERCAICHQSLSEDDIVFHPAAGFVHQREAPAEADVVRPSVIAYLRGGDSAADRQMFAAMRRLVESVLHHTLDRPLRSEGVLRSVLRTARLPK